MYRTSLILASLLASTRGQEEGCSVCGDGQRIGTPEAVFAFPGQPSVPCGSLQDAGAAGLISLSQCPFFPSLIGVCECEPIAPVSPPTPTIVLFAPPTTNAPVASPVKSPIAPVYIGKSNANAVQAAYQTFFFLLLTFCFVDGVNNDDDGGGAPVHSPGSSPTYSPPEYRYSPEGSPMQTFRPAFFSPVNVFPSTVLTPNGASPMYVYGKFFSRTRGPIY